MNDLPPWSGGSLLLPVPATHCWLPAATKHLCRAHLSVASSLPARCRLIVLLLHLFFPLRFKLWFQGFVVLISKTRSEENQGRYEAWALVTSSVMQHCPRSVQAYQFNCFQVLYHWTVTGSHTVISLAPRLFFPAFPSERWEKHGLNQVIHFICQQHLEHPNPLPHSYLTSPQFRPGSFIEWSAVLFSEQYNKDQSKKYPVENNVNMITIHQAICPTRQTHPNDQLQV